MSSTLSPFETAEECQNTFDRLVAASGVEASAADFTKLAALRKYAPEQIDRLLGNNMLIRPAWDSSWFTFQDQSTPMSCLTKFPSWIQGLTIGWMRDEFAMFHKIWKSWSPEQLKKVVTSAVIYPKLAEEILHVYGIDTDCQTDSVKGLVDFSTDSFYAALPIILAERNVPASVYRFDQTDTFHESVYKGYAYHCLDTPLLCRFPAVVGPQSPGSMRATADQLSRSLTGFIYGSQPWESFGNTGKLMLLNGNQSHQIDWPKDCRWRQFMSTKERSTEFANAGCALVSYMADFYMK